MCMCVLLLTKNHPVDGALKMLTEFFTKGQDPSLKKDL